VYHRVTVPGDQVPELTGQTAISKHTTITPRQRSKRTTLMNRRSQLAGMNTIHSLISRFVIKALSLVFFVLLLSACATPADPPTTPTAQPESKDVDAVKTKPGKTSRLIPPTKPATTAAISNELIIADTVVNQTVQQNIQTTPTDSPKLDATMDATMPDTHVLDKSASALTAKKLEQLTILAISGDSDAQVRLGDAYATSDTAETLINRDVADNDEVINAAEEAHRWYQLAANQGNHIAQFKLGLQYFHGKGTDKNYTMAREWWLESATQGSADAQQKLGYLYSEGLGVERDYNRAISWYSRAGHLGHAEAQTLLGSLYHEGNRVPQNYNEAFKWYKLAAEHGHPHAQYTLATLYHDGFGTDQDYVRCTAWVDVALANGYTDEFNARAECSRYLDDSELDKAASLAKSWKSSYVRGSDFN